jgi:cytochrome bd-type quinol oxidase subunit 2
MTSDSNRHSLLRPALFGLFSQLLAFLAVILVVTVYATYLAFQARGTPNQKLINEFAASSSPWVMALVGIALVFFFSLRLVKEARQQSITLGIVLGISSAVFATASAFVFRSHFSLQSLPVPAGLVLSGWAGAVLGLPRR